MGILFGGPTPEDGDSAYEIAVANGFIGTELQWLISLVGATGASAYQIAVANGFSGTISQWLLSLTGPPGPQGQTGASGNFSVGLLTPFQFGFGTSAASGITTISGGYCKINSLVLVNANCSNNVDSGKLLLPFRALYGVYGIIFSVGNAGSTGVMNVQPNSTQLNFINATPNFGRAFAFSYLTDM